jgi:hypothetical protein
MNAVNKFFEAGHTMEELASGALGSPVLIGVTAEQIAASRRPPNQAESGKQWWKFWQ